MTTENDSPRSRKDIPLQFIVDGIGRNFCTKGKKDDRYATLHSGINRCYYEVILESRTVNLMIGESGSGKSTLVSMLGTRKMSDKGKIWVSGLNSSDICVGVVGQKDKANTILTIWDYLFRIARITRPEMTSHHIKDRISSLTKELDIVHLMNRRICHSEGELSILSFGEQNLIRFIQGILLEPRLLIVDEIMTGVDIAKVQVMKNILDDYAARGNIVVVVAHQMSSEQISAYQKVLILSRGRIVFHEKPQLLFEKFGQLFPDEQSLTYQDIISFFSLNTERDRQILFNRIQIIERQQQLYSEEFKQQKGALDLSNSKILKFNNQMGESSLAEKYTRYVHSTWQNFLYFMKQYSVSLTQSTEYFNWVISLVLALQLWGLSLTPENFEEYYVVTSFVTTLALNDCTTDGFKTNLDCLKFFGYLSSIINPAKIGFLILILIMESLRNVVRSSAFIVGLAILSSSCSTVRTLCHASANLLMGCATMRLITMIIVSLCPNEQIVLLALPCFSISAILFSGQIIDMSFTRGAEYLAVVYRTNVAVAATLYQNAEMDDLESTSSMSSMKHYIIQHNPSVNIDHLTSGLLAGLVSASILASLCFATRLYIFHKYPI